MNITSQRQQGLKLRIRRSAMLTSVAATAANTAGHTAINKAKSSATNAAKGQLKKSFFRQRTAEEVVKKGQSGRAAEAIVGYKQSKILKISFNDSIFSSGLFLRAMISALKPVLIFPISFSSLKSFAVSKVAL